VELDHEGGSPAQNTRSLFDPRYSADCWNALQPHGWQWSNATWPFWLKDRAESWIWKVGAENGDLVNCYKNCFLSSVLFNLKSPLSAVEQQTNLNRC